MTFDPNSLSENDLLSALRKALTPAPAWKEPPPATPWNARKRHPDRECVTLWINGTYTWTDKKTGRTEQRGVNPMVGQVFQNDQGERIECAVLGTGRNYIPVEFWENTELRKSDLLAIIVEQGEVIIVPPGGQLPRGFHVSTEFVDALEQVCLQLESVEELEDVLELLPSVHEARDRISKRIAKIKSELAKGRATN